MYASRRERTACMELEEEGRGCGGCSSNLHQEELTAERRERFGEETAASSS